MFVQGLNDTKNVAGVIHTIDILPNNKRMYWNIIDDNESKKTRKSFLQNGHKIEEYKIY